MSIFIVTFDLSNSAERGQDYEKIEFFLKKLSDFVVKPLSNTYLISSNNLTCIIIRDRIMSILEESDCVFVASLSGHYASWNYLETNQLIKNLFERKG